MPVRYESLKIGLDLDYLQAQAHPTAVAALSPTHRVQLHDGDTLKLDYTCFVTYAADVVVAFEAIAELLDDPGVVVRASLDELHYGRCLFAEVVTALTRVIEKREAR